VKAMRRFGRTIPVPSTAQIRRELRLFAVPADLDSPEKSFEPPRLAQDDAV